MKLSTLDPGLLSVETRIRDLSQEFGRLVDCLEWLRSTDALYGQMTRARVVPLKIWRGGEFRILEVRPTDLDDVDGDPVI